MKKLFGELAAVVLIAIIVAAMILILVKAQEDNLAGRPAQETSLVNQSAKPLPSLPRTLAGYKRAFANLPAYSWGGGDISVTTVLSDGRAVWFFGDTLTKRGGHLWLNRNTALVQTGERMHAANDGVQILPTTRKFVYWPVKVAEVRPGVLKVWTSKIAVGNEGPWDFKRIRASETRTAKVLVNKAGNMKFVGWTGWTATPTDKSAVPADGSDTRILGPNHYGYQTIVHYDLPLLGGRHLVTESQNWDNHHANTLDYRPLLSRR